MAPDTMQVRLHLRLIRVLSVLVDGIDELVVSICSTRSWSRCPHCGFRCYRIHDTRTRRIRNLPVSGRPVTLVWHRRRFSCDGCGERHLEHHDEFEGRLTRRLARTVVADARVMSIRAVARRRGLSWPAVMELVLSWSTLLGTHRRSKRCRVLLIDETSMRRRHRGRPSCRSGPRCCPPPATSASSPSRRESGSWRPLPIERCRQRLHRERTGVLAKVGAVGVLATLDSGAGPPRPSLAARFSCRVGSREQG